MTEMEFRYCHSSRVVKKNCVYSWKINNFNLLPIIGGHYLNSKPFNFPRKYYHTWQVCLSKGSHAAQECNLKDFFETLQELKCSSKKLAEIILRVKPDVSKILEDSFGKLKSAINNLDSKDTMNGSDPEEYDVPDIVKRMSSNFKNLVDAEFLLGSDGKTITKAFKKVESDAKTIDELVQKMESEKSFSYEKSTEEISDVERSLDVSLKRLEDPDTYDYVTYSISLKAEDGTILKCFENRQLDDTKPVYYRIKEEQFCSKNWFEEKVLVVICEIEILHFGNDESIEIGDEEEQLSHDLEKLLLDESSSDFSLMAGSTKFPVHKFVLASRSEGFAELLKDGTKLNLQLEFGEDVVRQMIQYMYTGKFREDLSAELYSELLKAAVKYDIDFLDKRCMCLLEKLSKGPVICEMCSISKCD